MHIKTDTLPKHYRKFHPGRAGPSHVKPETILSRTDYRRIVAEIIG